MYYYYYFKNSADTVPIILLLLFSLTVTLQFQAKMVALPGSSCPKRCCDVDIVYSFGIGADCAMKGFEVIATRLSVGVLTRRSGSQLVMLRVPRPRC